MKLGQQVAHILIKATIKAILEAIFEAIIKASTRASTKDNTKATIALFMQAKNILFALSNYNEPVILEGRLHFMQYFAKILSDF